MGCRKCVIIIALLALFTLMEQAKPVAAGKKSEDADEEGERTRGETGCH